MPAPTPVTNDGLANPPHPEGHGGPDGGIFWRPFTGNAANGQANGHLYQDNPAAPGLLYLLTGWAGAEANALGRLRFAIEFLDVANNVIGGLSLDLASEGLGVFNGEPFAYRQFSVQAVAPAGTVNIRSRASMLDGITNPLGGGQAFVMDDFELTVVPEPSLAVLALSAVGLMARRRRNSATPV